MNTGSTASHCLNQCWPRSLMPYGVTRPQWVNHVHKLRPIISWHYSETNNYKGKKSGFTNNERHPISRPHGWAIGYLSWVLLIIECSVSAELWVTLVVSSITPKPSSSLTAKALAIQDVIESGTSSLNTTWPFDLETQGHMFSNIWAGNHLWKN